MPVASTTSPISQITTPSNAKTPSAVQGSKMCTNLDSGIVLTPPPPVKISYADVADELDFWGTSVVCYVLGANPPPHVVEGFVKRIWKPDVIDKIGTIAKGMYLVRMKSQEGFHAAYE